MWYVALANFRMKEQGPICCLAVIYKIWSTFLLKKTLLLRVRWKDNERFIKGLYGTVKTGLIRISKVSGLGLL